MGQEKQAGIQIARAIAALGIVYYHSWTALVRFPADTAHPIPWLRDYGYLSVDLFFAISGFVICMVVSRGFDLRSFAIKRVFRIYPLWLVMLTIFAATAWTWRGFQPSENLGFFLYSATLLPTDGYPFYNVGWTLQHEMAFYAIAAVSVPLLGVPGLAAVLCVSAASIHFVDLPPVAAKFASYHAEFLAGILVFMARDRVTRFGFLLPFAVGGAGFVACLAWSHPYWIPVALFFLIVAFANLKVSGPLAALGDASYSMYLIHPMVFFTVSALTSKLSMPIWAQEPTRFGCIAVIIGLSFAIWRWFERPMIRFGNEIASDNPHAGNDPSLPQIPMEAGLRSE